MADEGSRDLARRLVSTAALSCSCVDIHIQCHAALSEESSGDVTPFDGGRKERAPATVVQRVSPPLMQSTCVGLRRAGTDRSDVIAGSEAQSRVEGFRGEGAGTDGSDGIEC